MNTLLCGRFDAGERALWQRELAAACPQLRWFELDAARQLADTIELAIVANPPPGGLQGFPKLRLIHSLWAGVDRLLTDPTLPAGVPIVRMVDPAMNQAMAQTALWAVLALHRGFFRYARQQTQGLWQTLPQRRADELTVLVLGYGEMGRAAAQAIAAMGYRVVAWRRSGGRGDDGEDGRVLLTSGPDSLPTLLPSAQVVVNLLPLTAETRGLLDARFFAALPVAASIVNLARGAHLVEADLLAALDSGHLVHAVLDVFHTEPLPAAHPFWSHPQVTVLPHAAAATDARSAARVVAGNLARVAAGKTPSGLVQREAGY